MNKGKGLDLAVNAGLENLSEVRDYIDRAGSRLGVDQAVLADLRLVVDEAVTNIVLHGYEGLGGSIHLHMELEGDSVVVLIRDRAKPFQADQVQSPHLDTALADRPFGGMGVYLIRSMTDESEVKSLPGGGNELRLVKHGAIAIPAR